MAKTQQLLDDDTAAFAGAVREGVAAADGGQACAYEDVRRWLLSWGTAGELSPPRWVELIAPYNLGGAGQDFGVAK